MIDTAVRDAVVRVGQAVAANVAAYRERLCQKEGHTLDIDIVTAPADRSGDPRAIRCTRCHAEWAVTPAERKP